VTAIDRSPARLQSAIAVVLAILAVGISGAYSTVALATGVLGVLVIALGLGRGSYALVTTGSAAIAGGAMAAGALGIPPLALLVSVTAAVTAWDSAGNAISIGAQLGREADTTRIEVVHTLASVGVGVVTAGVGFGIYRAGTGGLPITAIVFSLIAAVLLVEAIG